VNRKGILLQPVHGYGDMLTAIQGADPYLKNGRLRSSASAGRKTAKYREHQAESCGGIGGMRQNTQRPGLIQPSHMGCAMQLAAIPMTSLFISEAITWHYACLLIEERRMEPDKELREDLQETGFSCQTVRREWPAPHNKGVVARRVTVGEH
jgi:hypothetical protein